jgi:hypothetical protein
MLVATNFDDDIFQSFPAQSFQRLWDWSVLVRWGFVEGGLLGVLCELVQMHEFVAKVIVMIG